MKNSLFSTYDNRSKKKKKPSKGAGSSKDKAKSFPTGVGSYLLSDAELEHLRFINEGHITKDTFEFIGSIPSKKNSRATSKKTGRSFSSSRYTGWYYAMTQQLKYMNIEKVKEEFSGRFRDLAITIYFPTYGVADLSNKTESIMDFLVDEYEHEGSKLEKQLLKDDNWKETGLVLMIPKYRKGIGGFKIEPLKVFLKEYLEQNETLF